MAKDVLVDVRPTESVTVAEVEQFKLVKASEKEFISALRVLVDGLLMKVGPRNPVCASMKRFLNNH